MKLVKLGSRWIRVSLIQTGILLLPDPPHPPDPQIWTQTRRSKAMSRWSNKLSDTWSIQKLEEAGKTHKAFRASMALWHLHLRLLASRTGRAQISVISDTQCVVSKAVPGGKPQLEPP